MKFHEPGITALFLLFLVSTLYLSQLAENIPFFSEVITELPKENDDLEIPAWADFTLDIQEVDIEIEEDPEKEEAEEEESIVETKKINLRHNLWAPDFDTCTVDNIGKSMRFHGSDEAISRLHNLFTNLNEIGRDERDAIHIFHFGDSQIECDRITGRIRSSWQKTWGGSGPGLIPATQPVPSLSVRQETEGDVTRYTRFGKVDTTLGHTCYGGMAALAVIKDSARIILKAHPMGFHKNKTWEEVEILFGAVPMGGTLKIYGQATDTTMTDIPPSSEGNHFAITTKLKGELEDLTISIEGYHVEITGIRLGSPDGVQVHNIPMRGSSGTLFSRLHKNHFKTYLQNWDVGMVILQYGGNAAPYISDSTSAERYGQRFGRQVKYIRSILPEAAVLVIGPSDMGQTLDSTKLSYPMLGNIRSSIREATIMEGGLFWDLSDVMGGPGTMEAWASAQPKLAAPDLVHFTPKGARKIGQELDRAFRAEYRTWAGEIRENKK